VCASRGWRQSEIVFPADHVVCWIGLASMNAPPMVDVGNLTDPLQIAMKELRVGKVPLIIRRYLPDGSFEDWPLADLTIDFTKH